MIYFDHNATTPLLAEAQKAWLEASVKFIGNPSSPHRIGARAEAALDGAREKLARFLGCHPLDIVWTSGATESNNAVLHHYCIEAGPKASLWVSAIEHPCILAAARHYFPRLHRLIPVTNSGVLDLSWLETELGKKVPALIAVMAANNETGVIQPWIEVLQLCRKYEVPFFCDAAQWIGKMPAKELGECDFVSGCAHKFGGPKGVGFLKCPPKGQVHPLLRGGKQEGGRRAGTENVAGVLAMMAALELRESALARDGVLSRLAQRDAFEQGLLKRLPGLTIIGKGQERLWNTVSAVMPETDCRQRWVVKLDKAGLAVSTGSACASGSEEPSHVLAAMGLSQPQASRALRFSSSWETTDWEWEELGDALVRVYHEFREAGGQDGTEEGTTDGH